MAESILNKIIIESPEEPVDFKKLEKLLPQIYLTQNRQKNSSIHILTAKNQSKTLILGGIAIEIFDSTNYHSTSSPCVMKTAKISYIHVKKTWRKLQIGNALMKAAEELCGNEGGSRISILFDRSDHAAHALTSQKRGWSEGELVNGYTFSSKQSMGPVLDDLERLNRLSIKRTDGVTVQPLGHCDEDELILASQADAIPEWAQLNKYKLALSARDYSRVVYRDNRIIGWLITYPLGPETLDYRILWTDQAQRNTGATLAGLIEIIRDAHFQDPEKSQNETNDFGIPWRKGFFLVHRDNRAMSNFANKRLEGAKPIKSELIFKEKQLSGNTDQGSEAC